MVGDLPKSVIIDGEEWDIRTDYRDILKVLLAFNDPNIENAEKIFICLKVIYEGFSEMPEEEYEIAFREAIRFIDYDLPESKRKGRNIRMMDWEQDGNMLFAALNKVAGREIRSLEYLHWWTLMGYFMEIPTDGVFGSILRLRQKKHTGKKKLDKAEKEFWSNNRELCEIKPKLSDEEKAAKERLKKLLM